MNKCCGILGRLLGHNYQPRYDEAEAYPTDVTERLESALARITTTKAVLLSDDVRAMRVIEDAFRGIGNLESFYVQDVCARCGEVVGRIPDPIDQLSTEELLQDAVERVKFSGPVERAKLVKMVHELASAVYEVKQGSPCAHSWIAGSGNQDHGLVCVKCGAFAPVE